ncbi:MAG: hypothetical protein P1U89_16185 [Verrucomicrobiales bacterium]|nr:hypothetical protein [Verrucomicrobiales bacterium]
MIRLSLGFTLGIFVISCSEEPTSQNAPDIIGKTVSQSIDDGFVVPEMPDLLDYAATDVPSEPFRFEYQFHSEPLAFTIKANQLNERVISDITFADGTNFPIEMYVNQYRTLVADLANATEKKEVSSTGSVTQSIVVQSIAKTRRITGESLPLSPELIEWIAKHLQNDTNREIFRTAIGQPE